MRDPILASQAHVGQPGGIGGLLQVVHQCVQLVGLVGAVPLVPRQGGLREDVLVAKPSRSTGYEMQLLKKEKAGACSLRLQNSEFLRRRPTCRIIMVWCEVGADRVGFASIKPATEAPPAFCARPVTTEENEGSCGRRCRQLQRPVQSHCGMEETPQNDA